MAPPVLNDECPDFNKVDAGNLMTEVTGGVQRCKLPVASQSGDGCWSDRLSSVDTVSSGNIIV